MVSIALPPDTHRRLLEGAPSWSRTYKLLAEATEMRYAVGVRRIHCDLADAQALLQVAERVYPECAPLISSAIRRAGPPQATPPHARASQAHVFARPPRVHAHGPEPVHPRRRAVSLHRVAGFHLFVIGFQLLQVLDRGREFLRRFL